VEVLIDEQKTDSHGAGSGNLSGTCGVDPSGDATAPIHHDRTREMPTLEKRNRFRPYLIIQCKCKSLTCKVLQLDLTNSPGQYQSMPAMMN
jgi:hypothetical protein